MGVVPEKPEGSPDERGGVDGQLAALLEKGQVQIACEAGVPGEVGQPAEGDGRGHDESIASPSSPSARLTAFEDAITTSATNNT